MRKQLFFVGALALSMVGGSLYAQENEQTKNEKLDEVVVTATKFDLKKEHTGKVIYTISQKEIQQNAGNTVVQLLNNLPGIEINGANSNRGRQIGTYIRGGRSRQVLVLIDGIPVSDASGINQSYDLRLLSLNQIEKIEVLKGAASTLYGTGAATGVINIILKKSSKQAIRATYEASIGTYNDSKSFSARPNNKNQNVSINGTLGNLKYLAYFDLTGVEGLSAAKSKTDQVFEDDSFYSKNALVKLGYDFTENLDLGLFLNYDEFDSEFDAGAYRDEARNTWAFSQVRYGVKPKFSYENGEVYVLASFNKITRDLKQYSSFSKSINESMYEGTAVNIDVVNKYAFMDNKFQVITGFNFQEHKNETNTPFAQINKDVANFTTSDPYVSMVYISDFGLNVNAGGRLNIHSNYGNHFVYDGNVSYNVMNTNDYGVKLLASYGTAFIAPSTYQLFSQYGALTLNPETSATFEAGFESYYKNYKLNAVFFNRKVNDAIVFQSLSAAPWGVYANSNGTVKTNGVEVLSEAKPLEYVKLTANYTYTNKDDNEGANNYIPKHKVVAGVELTPIKNAAFAFVYKHIGDRTVFDKYGSFGPRGETVTIDSYNLLDFTANYSLLNKKVTFFGTVSNIFNTDFEETLGFSTLGRNVKLGVRLNF